MEQSQALEYSAARPTNTSPVKNAQNWMTKRGVGWGMLLMGYREQRVLPPKTFKVLVSHTVYFDESCRPSIMTAAETQGFPVNLEADKDQGKEEYKGSDQ